MLISPWKHYTNTISVKQANLNHVQTLLFFTWLLALFKNLLFIKNLLFCFVSDSSQHLKWIKTYQHGPKTKTIPVLVLKD